MSARVFVNDLREQARSYKKTKQKNRFGGFFVPASLYARACIV
jgi:hypothetical protein